jgi:hypothetical protein
MLSPMPQDYVPLRLPSSCCIQSASRHGCARPGNELPLFGKTFPILRVIIEPVKRSRVQGVPRPRGRVGLSSPLRCDRAPLGSRPFGLPSLTRSAGQGREGSRKRRGPKSCEGAGLWCRPSTNVRPPPHATCARCPGVAHWFQRSTSCVGQAPLTEKGVLSLLVCDEAKPPFRQALLALPCLLTFESPAGALGPLAKVAPGVIEHRRQLCSWPTRREGAQGRPAFSCCRLRDDQAQVHPV